MFAEMDSDDEPEGMEEMFAQMMGGGAGGPGGSEEDMIESMMGMMGAAMGGGGGGDSDEAAMLAAMMGGLGGDDSDDDGGDNSNAGRRSGRGRVAGGAGGGAGAGASRDADGAFPSDSESSIFGAPVVPTPASTRGAAGQRSSRSPAHKVCAAVLLCCCAARVVVDRANGADATAAVCGACVSGCQGHSPIADQHHHPSPVLVLHGCRVADCTCRQTQQS